MRPAAVFPFDWSGTFPTISRGRDELSCGDESALFSNAV